MEHLKYISKSTRIFYLGVFPTQMDDPVMNNGPVYFEIQTDAPAQAIAFYGDVFGWTFCEEKGLPTAYWRIETGGAMGGLLQRPAKAPPLRSGTNAFVCSMEVADFDRVAQTIMKRGGLVALPKFPVPGRCWHGYFIDPDGNTFGIFQPDAKAGT